MFVFIVTNEISVNIFHDDLSCYLVSDAILGLLTFGTKINGFW